MSNITVCCERPLVFILNITQLCIKTMVCLCRIWRVGYQMRTHVSFACVWMSNTSTALPGPAMMSKVKTKSVIADYSHSIFFLVLQNPKILDLDIKLINLSSKCVCSSSMWPLWNPEGEERIQVLPRVWVWYVKKLLKNHHLLYMMFHYYY